MFYTLGTPPLKNNTDDNGSPLENVSFECIFCVITLSFMIHHLLSIW